MIKPYPLIVLFILSFDNINAFDKNLNKWHGEKWLDHSYLLKWMTDNIKNEISFKVEVKTKGWVSFGLSKHGRMNEVDKVIGWVDHNGQSHFHDYWVCRTGVETVDRSQDWTLLSASENSTHTVLEFSRKFVTCDDVNDLDIYENDYEFSNIVFEYSYNDPNDANKGNITHQGLFHVNLVHPRGVPYNPKEKDIKVHDFWLNVTVPSKPVDSHYCQMFKLEDLNPLSIIKVEPYVSSNTSVYHYLNLLKCPKEWAEKNFKRYKDNVFGCYDIDNPLHEGRLKCKQELIVSISTGPLVLPDFVDIPLDTVETTYVMLHGHFFNDLNKDINMTTSLQMWSTFEKRKMVSDFQIFGMKDDLDHKNWPFLLPPKQESFWISSVASSYCLNNEDEMDDIGLFLFALQFQSCTAETHEVRHFRKDHLLRVLRIHHYDVNFQPFRHLLSPINFRKTDKLGVTCEFNTINETKSFTGMDERCTLIAYYYPKMKNIKDAKFIKSRMTYETMLNITDLDQIDNYNGLINDTVIRKPVEFNNTKLIDFITDNKYGINSTKGLERMQMMSDSYECCGYLSESEKNETCKIIKKPPGMYEAIIGKEIHKYCWNSELTEKTETKGTYGFNMDKFNMKLPSFKVPNLALPNLELPKIKISFKLVMDQFKLFFQTSSI